MTRAVNRRAFLATGALATAGLAVAGARPSGAATPGVAVYRLSADWGYPVGPKGKTRCSCRACFRRAENAYFLTEGAAIAGRIHPCCVCQPYLTSIPGVSAPELFLEDQSVDRRDPRIAAVFANITAPSQNPLTALVSGDPASPASDPGAAPASFARTGTSLRLAGIGAAVLSLGGLLVAFRNRRTPEPATTDPSHPSTKEPS